MSDRGWLKLHRSITDHWLWEEKPFSFGQAWIDILLRANHEEKKVPVGNETVIVPAGAFITSELKLMDAWGWSKTKTRRFLSLLENDGMIIKKTDHRKTTINIVNWGNFQILETKNEPIEDHKETDERPIKDTNKNIRKIDSLQNLSKKKGTFQKPTVDEVRDFIREQGYHVSAEQFVNWYEANGWMVGRNKMKSWQAAVRNWEQREKKDKQTAFNTFDQRTYDYADLTERLAAKG